MAAASDRTRVTRSARTRRDAHARVEGMTLIEIVIVIAIIGLAGSGLSFSLGALTKSNLRSSAAKVAAAARYAYNRALIQGSTVRIAFEVPGETFSIEEASGRVTLARVDDESRTGGGDENAEEVVAADPWVAAKARIEQAMAPTLGASPFQPLRASDGTALKRYANVTLGRRVRFVKLIVPHHPAPVDAGKVAVHFFPGGMTEHAVIHLSDGGDAVYSIELHPLTGQARVRSDAYEPRELLGDPENRDTSEVDL